MVSGARWYQTLPRCFTRNLGVTLDTCLLLPLAWGPTQVLPVPFPKLSLSAPLHLRHVVSALTTHVGSCLQNLDPLIRTFSLHVLSPGAFQGPAHKQVPFLKSLITFVSLHGTF